MRFANILNGGEEAAGDGEGEGEGEGEGQGIQQCVMMMTGQVAGLSNIKMQRRESWTD